MTHDALTFFAHCPECGKPVSATLVNSRDKILAALTRGEDVRAMHIADRDHIWNLSDAEKANLRKRIREGLV